MDKKKKVKNNNYSEMTLSVLKTELQKVRLSVQSGSEKNTSLIKKIKKEIARKLTLVNKK